MQTRSQLSPTGLQQFLELLPVIGLLWLFFFSRAHAIENMGYFVDELRHIGRAQIVWSFSDIDISTTPHKFLIYYWIGLFDPPHHLPAWVSRTAVVIYTLLGAAGTFALARLLFSRRVALWSLMLLIVFPFMFFYDRLALSDPLASPMVVLTAWWSIITVFHPTRRNAVILGLAANLMLVAKILAGPMLVLPIAAALCFGPYRLRRHEPLLPQLVRAWHAYRTLAIIAVSILVAFWGTTLGFYGIRSLLSTEPASPIVNSYLYRTAGPLENVRRVMAIFRYLWSLVLLVLMLVAGSILAKRRPYTVVFLLSGILPLWLILVGVAKELTSRYLTLTGHLLVVMVVGGLWLLQDELAIWLQKQAPAFRVLAWAPLVLLALWMVAFGGRFWLTLIDDPLQLNLPRRDTHEYFRNQTSYGLSTLMLDVAQMENISHNSRVPVLIGETRNCSFGAYLIPRGTPLKLECSVYSVRHRDEWPPLKQRMDHLNASLNKYGPVYLMVERFDDWDKLVDETMVNGELELVRSYSRPFAGIPIELYIVYPRDNAVNTDGATSPAR